MEWINGTNHHMSLDAPFLGDTIDYAKHEQRGKALLPLLEFIRNLHGGQKKFLEGVDETEMKRRDIKKC